MTDDEFLLQLARLLTRREDLTTTESRRALLELALRLRALLATLPADGQILRTIRYNDLRPRILALLQDFTTTYYASIRTTLPALATALRTLITTYLVPTTPLPTLDLPTLLSTSNVLTRPTSILLAPTSTGISPFTLQLERLLDTSIRAAIARDASPTELLNLITPTTRRIQKSTIANAWLDRTAATTAAIYWSLVTPSLAEANSSAVSAASRWRWNAVLDPKTCPICRPLHNTVAATPAAFPNGAPPLHPRCRCICLPV